MHQIKLLCNRLIQIDKFALHTLNQRTITLLYLKKKKYHINSNDSKGYYKKKLFIS